MKLILAVLVILFDCCVTCYRRTYNQNDGKATFSFASYYGDHMVLQKAPKQAVVWGYGETGENVSVTILGHDPVTAKIQQNGQWMVKLPPISDTKPYTITAKTGTQTIMLNDVLFGDVWICSGQSNMVFTLDMANNATAEVQDAKNFPNIRVFTASQESSDKPLDDLKSVEEKWSIPNEDTVGHQAWTYFSAVCWLFGKRIFQERGYPIGLVASAWGGTAIELWSSPNVLKLCGLQQRQNEEISALTHSSLWNAMMHPFTKMSIYGAIWYQGEANAGKPNTYNCTFPAMINDWRSQFNTNSGGETDKDFPFGFVQLAANRDYAKINTSTGFPDIRWHQTADMGYVPNYIMNKVFMAVAMDLPDFSSPYGSIHPRDKQDVANRLFMSGLAVAYNKVTNTRYQGPWPSAYYVDIGYRTLGIEYDNRSTHIDVRSMNGFEVCCSPNNQSQCNDETSKWMPAPIVKYDAYSVTTWYEACSKSDWVVGLRYAWRESPCDFFRCAVYSKENGLPAPPFIQIGLFSNKKYDRSRTKSRVIY